MRAKSATPATVNAVARGLGDAHTLLSFRCLLPLPAKHQAWSVPRLSCLFLVRPRGFEPLTFCSGGKRSIALTLLFLSFIRPLRSLCALCLILCRRSLLGVVLCYQLVILQSVEPLTKCVCCCPDARLKFLVTPFWWALTLYNPTTPPNPNPVVSFCYPHSHYLSAGAHLLQLLADSVEIRFAIAQ